MVVALVVHKALQNRKESAELQRMLDQATELSIDLERRAPPGGLTTTTHAEQPHQAVASRSGVAPTSPQAARASTCRQGSDLGDGGEDGGSGVPSQSVPRLRRVIGRRTEAPG